MLFFVVFFLFWGGGGGSFEVARKGGRSGCTGVVVTCAILAGCLFLFLRLHRRETVWGGCLSFPEAARKGCWKVHRVGCGIWGGCLSFPEAVVEARGYIGVDVVFGVDTCLFLRL